MAAPLSFAAENCKRGEYYFNAYKNSGNLPASDAVAMLERAVEACSRWEYWQKLGETAEKLNDPAQNARIAEAYVAAYDIAGTDAERALSAGRYGELLLNTGDPQNALKYVHHARNLTPDDPWLDDLATRVNQRVAQVDVDDIKRGLGDALFKPLHLNRAVTDSGSGGAGSPPERMRTINVPIQFEVNSVELSERTRRNLAALASALTDAEFAGDDFLIVGHADRRGDPAYNLQLSRDRADAIRGAMLDLQPDLRGRLITDGRGSLQPLSRGRSPEDHQINRRVEVIVIGDG
jgi:outer membrane protein OmpA-like peptidoglycan-associated protein